MTLYSVHKGVQYTPLYTLIHPCSSLLTPTHPYPTIHPIQPYPLPYTLIHPYPLPYTLIHPCSPLFPHSTLSPPIHPYSPPFTPTHPNSPVFTTHHQVVGMILDNGATPDLTMVPLLTTWLSTGIKGLFRGRTRVCVRACMCVRACVCVVACMRV